MHLLITRTQWWSFLLALGIALILTPIAIRLGLRLGITDKPEPSATDDVSAHRQRVNRRTTPRTGGIAIVAACMTSTLLFTSTTPQLVGILVGGTLVFAGMLLDDMFDIPAVLKLLIQSVAAIVVIACGVRVTALTDFFHGGFVQIGFVGVVLTYIWIVGITNAMNLIDGLDGLAGGVSALVILAMFFFAAFKGMGAMGAILAALLGAVLGFLVFNYHPAKIFLGDAGSQFLGFMIACLSVYGALKLPTTVMLFVSVFALGIPIAETVSSIFRRAARHQSPMMADNGHFHYRLLLRGWSQRRITTLYYAVTFMLCSVGLAIALLTGVR
ncbi:MAG: MraY family glycosyltransferase [Caldisericota bacterium]|jgi:UDP-GlcNAc:undecaprenyl-phosphate GlcNAc-1-phosphate transferase|nr:MraY family glycosyltransferase [Caldisericota bacterium]